jgi:hypothetical protein
MNLDDVISFIDVSNSIRMNEFGLLMIRIRVKINKEKFKTQEKANGFICGSFLNAISPPRMRGRQNDD